MKKVITLEIGNSSWWKNRKYRREAAYNIRELRGKGYDIQLLKKYRLDESNTILYGDYEIKYKNKKYNP
tara:strand:+ start:133 stop:339 length:207 start_codon:yes stop_codon:yes gene_type:complete